MIFNKLINLQPLGHQLCHDGPLLPISPCHLADCSCDSWQHPSQSSRNQAIAVVVVGDWPMLAVCWILQVRWVMLIWLSGYDESFVDYTDCWFWLCLLWNTVILIYTNYTTNKKHHWSPHRNSHPIFQPRQAHHHHFHLHPLQELDTRQESVSCSSKKFCRV